MIMENQAWGNREMSETLSVVGYHGGLNCTAPVCDSSWSRRVTRRAAMHRINSSEETVACTTAAFGQVSRESAITW